MPQMSPMPWTFMLILMMIVLIMFSSVLYFSFSMKPLKSKLHDNKIIFNIWSYSKF